MRAPVRPSRAILFAALAAAVLGMGISGPLVRIAEAPALAIAFWRMAIATATTAALWLAAPAAGTLRHYGLREWRLTALAGIFLAVHFASWIESLSQTTVAASVVLVNTYPAFVAILAAVFLGERTTPLQGVGILVAMVGAAVVSTEGSPGPAAGKPLLGALLALLGALSVAAYYAIGRSLRRTTGLWAYVTRVYAVSAAALLAFAALAGTRLAPYPARTWIVFAALVAGPTLLGHTTLNWSLRWLPAAGAAVASLGESIVAAALAAALPSIGEVPGPRTICGAALTLAGIALVLSRAGRDPSEGRKA
ncbi:MAG: DMT family transporter [Planctomycetota bacterium]